MPRILNKRSRLGNELNHLLGPSSKPTSYLVLVVVLVLGPEIGEHTEDGDERGDEKEFAIKAVRKPSAFLLASHAAARARNSLRLGAPLPPNSRRFAHEVRISGYFGGSFRS